MIGIVDKKSERGRPTCATPAVDSTASLCTGKDSAEPAAIAAIAADAAAEDGVCAGRVVHRGRSCYNTDGLGVVKPAGERNGVRGNFLWAVGRRFNAFYITSVFR